MSRGTTAGKPHGDSPSPAAAGGFGEGFLERCVIAALLLACAVATSKSLADPDLWGHVQYGHDLLNEGLPMTASYSYTAGQQRWINHEHLAELALALGSRTLGGGGLLVLKSLLAVAVIYRLMQRAQRAGASRTTIFLVLLLTAANLMHFWSLRPQLLTFLGFFLLLELLDAEPNLAGAATGEQHRNHRIWLAVPLMLLWANAHGGFLIGLVVATTYLGGRWLQLLAQPGTAMEKLQRGGLAALRGGGLVAAMFAATLINPYGFGLYRWLLGSLGQPRPEIVEWLPPEILTIAWLPFWLAAGLGCIAWLCSRRPRDLAQGLVLALLLYAAASHRRHIALFALAFGFWITPHLDDLLHRLGAGREEVPLDASLSPRTRPAAAVLLLAVCGALTWIWGMQSYQIPVRRDGYPVSALQYMADHGLHGRLVSRFKWAQYSLAAFASQPKQHQVQLAFDGRFRTCYPQEVVDMYFDFALGDNPAIARSRSPRSPSIAPSRILEYRLPELVLIDRSQTVPVALMQERTATWTLLYQDEIAQLWGRREIFDEPSSPRYLPPQVRQITNAPQRGVVAWPALPQFPSRPENVTSSTIQHVKAAR